MSTSIASAAAPNVLRPMLPATADLATAWAFIERGLNQIMAATNLQIDFPQYTSLYTVVYNYCTSSRMPNTTGDTDGGSNRTGANLMGSDLYNNLIRYFIVHLKQLKDRSDSLQDEALLRYYAAEWDRYTTGANYINRLFSFLNRHWVKRERDEGRKGVYPVYTLALMQWKVHFFLHVQSKLTGAILRLIERERKGETIDQDVMKKAVDSFLLLGLDEMDINKVSFDVYKEHLEKPFLEATEKYYEREPEPLLAEGTLSDYLRRAEERVKEEEDRVDRYLKTETREHLVHVLIRQHFRLIWESHPNLHEFDRDDDLQMMHAFLSRTPEDLEPLAKKFEDHVRKTGLATVAKLLAEQSDGVDSLDPKAYVDTLLEVHRKHSEIVTRSFSGVAGLVAALDEACKEVVNRNAATSSSTTKSPELLVKCVDMLLRKNNQMAEEEDLEGALNRVMVLFKYIEDKDVFQTFYAAKLSKRLIDGVSASDESEASMISKLEEACGVEYTNKLQKIFTDTSLRKDLTGRFKERMPNHDVDATNPFARPGGDGIGDGHDNPYDNFFEPSHSSLHLLPSGPSRTCRFWDVSFVPSLLRMPSKKAVQLKERLKSGFPTRRARSPPSPLEAPAKNEPTGSTPDGKVRVGEECNKDVNLPDCSANMLPGAAEQNKGRRQQVLADAETLPPDVASSTAEFDTNENRTLWKALRARRKNVTTQMTHGPSREVVDTNENRTFWKVLRARGKNATTQMLYGPSREVVYACRKQQGYVARKPKRKAKLSTPVTGASTTAAQASSSSQAGPFLHGHPAHGNTSSLGQAGVSSQSIAGYRRQSSQFAGSLTPDGSSDSDSIQGSCNRFLDCICFPRGH